MQQLIQHLITTGYLKTPKIIEAFKKIGRADFVSEDLKEEADLNIPLPIGYGQTISQPLTVAFMLELLQPEQGNRILDIGSGSGWNTALLAEIVGPSGKVFAIERLKELCDFGQRNVAKYSFIEKGITEFICVDGTKGWSEKAPFDRIIAAASAKEMPLAWQEQLKVPGRLVVSIKESIWLWIKKDEKVFEKKEYPGFAFVPLISD